MILADKIIAERKKNGWSQEELADKLGVSRQSVSKWEGAQAVPDLQRILQMSQIFGVSTDYLLKDELEEEEYTMDNADGNDLPVRRVSLDEANKFLAVKKETAPRIAFATFLCILSPICLLFFGAAQETGMISITENAAGGIGMVMLLLLIAAGVSIFISCGMKTKEYEYFENQLIDIEYGVAGMVKEKRAQYKPLYTKYIILGTVCCISGVLPIFVGVIFTENDFVLMLMVCLLLVIEGIGVMLFINAGIIEASFSKLLQEGDYSVRKKKTSKLSQTVGTIYWLIATAIFLAYSLPTNDWGRSWIIWPIAGVLFPAVIAVVNIFNREEK